MEWDICGVEREKYVRPNAEHEINELQKNAGALRGRTKYTNEKETRDGI